MKRLVHYRSLDALALHLKESPPFEEASLFVTSESNFVTNDWCGNLIKFSTGVAKIEHLTDVTNTLDLTRTEEYH